MVPQATYACTNGPRFESPAEVRLLTSWGGDVVGMTGVPEVALARELEMHFAVVALSMNLSVGLEEELSVIQLCSQRMYSERALLRLRRIVSMTGLGVNLPGAEVICNLLERLEERDHQLEALRHQLQRLLEE